MRLQIEKHLLAGGNISIHAPTWGATKWCITPSKCVNYFNPRTHVGCDKVVVKNILIPCISIHAPTWGATESAELLEPLCAISIHAPTWGATNREGVLGRLVKFQSTHPRGVRLLAYYKRLKKVINFNPRTHVGCDSLCQTWKEYATDFNPRTHVGCDGNSKISKFSRVYFNPRTHVGCDALKCEIKKFPLLISIHAPTWGATLTNKIMITTRFISIHAPTWGATVKPSNGWLLGHKDNEFANENIIIINSVNIT